MVSHGAKELLKNVIKQTDSHNKRVEMAEMWQQRQLHIEPTQFQSYHTSSKARKRDVCDRDYDDDNDREIVMPTKNRGSKHAHMDDLLPSSSTYYTRQLQKFEECNPDRWGHGGFKEMHPSDFESDRSASDTPKNEIKSSKKKKSKKKSRKKKIYSLSDSDSERNIKVKRKKKHKQKNRDNRSKSQKKSKLLQNGSDLSEKDVNHKTVKRKRRKYSNESDSYTDEITKQKYKKGDTRSDSDKTLKEIGK